MHVLAAAVAMLALIVGSAGCARDVSQAIDDATLAARVRTALLNDPAIGADQIDVQVHNGVVTLSGTVGSPADQQRALDLVRGVNGVTRVESHLQIQPPRPLTAIHPF